MTTLTTPLSIPDLLAGPDLDRSAARAVRDLAGTYATWDAVEADALPEDLLRTNHHLKQQRTQVRGGYMYSRGAPPELCP